MKKSPKTSARIFSNSLTRPLAVSVAALLMATPVVHAATYTWNTAVTSGTWDNTSSWVSGTIPTSTDLAYFANTVATSGTLANDAVLGLQFANTAALTLGSGTIAIGTSGINHTATGGVTIGSAVLLSGNQTWTNVASGTLTISGSIGASSAGSVVLTNTGAGATTISGVIGNGAGTVSLNQSAGTLTLTGANTFSGGVTLKGGTLLVQGNSTPTSGVVTSGPLGTGTLTLNGGTFGFAGTTAYTIANKVNVVGATNIEVASGQNDVLSGNWSGSGNLTLVPNGSTGQWTFSGDNSGYTGIFTQNTGNTSLTFSNASAGSANAAWIFNNNGNQRTRLNFGTGTISFGSLSGNGSIANIAGSGVATVSVGGLNSTTTFNGVLGGSTAGQGQNINLLIVGGSLTLNSANTYTGTTTVENGSLITGANVAVSTAGAFGNAATAIVLGDANTISSGTAMNPKLLIGGAFTVARNITVGANNNALGNSSTTFTMGGSTANTATFSGTTTLNQDLSVTQVAGGALNLSGNFTSGASGAQTVTLDNVGSVVASGTIGGGTGVIGLTKSNTGTATITGANTYTGATNITNGTLILSGSGAINSSSGITINGSGAKLVQASSVANTTAITLTQGTLDGTGTVGDVTVGAGTGGILTNGNGSNTALTVSSLNFLGSGTASLHLAGGATNSPALIVNGLLTTVGTVTLNLTPTTPWNNGTIYNLISYGSYSGNASNFTLGSTTGLSGRQTGTFGVSNGFVTLDVEGDTPVWTGLNSQWIQYAQNSSTSANPSFALKTNHTTTDFWNLDNAEFNDTYNVGSGDVAVTNGTVTIHGGNISATVLSFHNSAVDYNVTSDDGSSIIAGAITKDGSGALTISNANSYNGGTTLNAGTLNINHASAIGTGALTINGGTIDNTSGAAITLINNNAQYWNGDFIFNGTNDLNLGTGAVTLGASPTVTVKRGTLTVGGGIGGSFGLTKSGTGTLVLAGASTYNGGTTIKEGVVKVGNATALGVNSSAVNVNSGAALDLNGTTMTGQNALTLNGSGFSNGGAVTNSSTTAATYAGLVSLGSDSRIVASNGGIILSNTGTITGSGYNLTLDGTANGSSIASNIGTGSGSVTKNGTGTWTLGGANTYSGGTILNAGTLLVQGNSTPTSGVVTSGPLGTGTLTINGGTFGFAGATTYTIANNVKVTGATNIETASNTNEVLNGNWSGNGNLTLVANGSTGQWQFGGDNSGYTGTFTQNGGNTSLAFNNASAGSANAAWVFNNPGAQRTRLNFGAGTINFGSISGNGSIANIAASGTSTMSVGALNSTTTFSGVIGDGTGQALNINLVIVGGSLTLSGSNNYTGATTVNAGELDVNGSLAAASTVGVASGAVLGGSGTVGGVVNLNGGTLRGNGLKVVGQINATGNSNVSNVNGNVNATGGVNVSNGATLGGSGNITGTVGVTNATINGSGLSMTSATFDGNSRLTGTTTISGGASANSGTLSITGGSITGAVTVNTGATLAGAGSVTGLTVGSGATLSPGTASDSAPVTMISNGNISFTDETSTFAIRLGVTSATDSDVLSVVGGTVDLGSATLSLSLGGAFYTALTNGQLTAGERWTVIQNSDLSSNSLSGIFTQGFEITGTGAGGDYKFAIGYGQINGTDSNVYLELEAVPEPSTWAMIVGGMGMLAFGRRFRRVMEE